MRPVHILIGFVICAMALCSCSGGDDNGGGSSEKPSKTKNANANPPKNAMIFSRRSFDEKQLKKLSPEKQKKHTPTGERSVAEIMNRLETIKKFM